MGHLINFDTYRGRIHESKTPGELVKNLLVSIDANFYSQTCNYPVAQNGTARIKAEQSMSNLQKVHIQVKKLK